LLPEAAPLPARRTWPPLSPFRGARGSPRTVAPALLPYRGARAARRARRPCRPVAHGSDVRFCRSYCAGRCCRLRVPREL